jgi:hypothetical protein
VEALSPVPDTRRVDWVSLAAATVAAGTVTASLVHLAVQTRLYFVDVPFWDEWLLLPLIILREQGALSASDLIAAHNEHRPLFPRLLLLALAGLTRWNLWYECVANIVLGLVTLAPLFLWIHHDRRLNALQRVVLYVSTAVVFLSLNQWENWMWGWQVQVFLTTAALTWGTFVLASNLTASAVPLAAGCGIVATFSFGNGLLFWPATLPLAWFKWRRRPGVLASWIGIATVTIAVYFRGLGGGGLYFIGPSTLDLLRTVHTASRMLGSALASDAHVIGPALVGLVGLVLVIPVAFGVIKDARGGDVTSLTWTTILAFGLGSVLLIALGRVLPVNQAIPSRYVGFANLHWMAIAALLTRRWWWAAMPGLLISVMATVAGVDARPLYAARKASLLSARSALYAPVDNPLLDRFFWDRAFVAAHVGALRQLRLSLYDCSRQLSEGDWRAAARAIETHSRPGDLVIASNDWGAACLTERLHAGSSSVTVVSSGESRANVQASLESRPSAFLVTGGDARSFDARTWIERHGFPIYRSPIGSMRLFYYPDRIAYVRDRLRPDEVMADRLAFGNDVDLVEAEDNRFFLWGWDHPRVVGVRET